MIDSPLGLRRFRLVALLGLLGTWAPLAPAAPTETEPAWPPVAELASRLRSIHPDLPDPVAGETNSAAYLRSLAPLVLTSPPASEEASAPAILRSQVYSRKAGYLRLGSVDADFATALRDAVTNLVRTGAVAGLVLDLRFASGSDFSAAAKAAGVFADRSPQPLRLGTSTFPLEAEAPPVTLPVILLVHRQTRGAAEALAAAVRSASRRSLILGTPTAGEARRYQRVSLADGLEVRVAADPLLLPGGEPFPPSGLVPDLRVPVAPEDEARYFTNEFARPEASAASRELQRFRLNEAELVRRMRGSEGRDRRPTPTSPAPVATPETAPEPAVQDPVLARAVDLISGYSDLPAAPSATPATGDSR